MYWLCIMSLNNFLYNFYIISLFFFFNDTATTEIYTLSLHDALPISSDSSHDKPDPSIRRTLSPALIRSEEHTSELQSRSDLVCRLLLEKKKQNEHHDDFVLYHSKNSSFLNFVIFLTMINLIK